MLASPSADTWSGELLEEKGVVPDYAVNTHDREGDVPLERAVEVLNCQGRSKRFPPRRRKRGPLVTFGGGLPLTFGGGWSGALRRP
jgi:hypothetical protein